MYEFFIYHRISIFIKDPLEISINFSNSFHYLFNHLVDTFCFLYEIVKFLMFSNFLLI